MGTGRGLCDDILHRRMRTCVLSVSFTVGRSVCLSIPALRLGTLVLRQKLLLENDDHLWGEPKL